MTPTAAIDRPHAGGELAPRRWRRADFNRATLVVARDLLGKFIVRRIDGAIMRAMIAETEAYKGPRDRAAHSYGGRRTPRVEPLYGDGGTMYVYFVYGMHWMLNFSTAGAGLPEGVLIRAVVIDHDSGATLQAGPGRITRQLQIDGKLDGADATTSDRLWVEDCGLRVPARAVKKGPRVGVDYAGPFWAARPWRFALEQVSAESLAMMRAAGTRNLHRAPRPRHRGDGPTGNMPKSRR